MHDLRAGLRRRKRSLELDANFHADQRLPEQFQELFAHRQQRDRTPTFLGSSRWWGSQFSTNLDGLFFSRVSFWHVCPDVWIRDCKRTPPGFSRPPKGSSLEPPWAALASWRQAFPSFANPSSSGEAWFTTPPATPDFPWNGVFVWLPRKSEPPSPPCHPLRCAGRAFPAFWERCHNDLSQ